MESLEQRLAAYVSAGATNVGGATAAYVSECYAEAVALVDHLVGNASVPAPIYDRAVIEAGSDLYFRKSTPQGVYQNADSTVRVGRDPRAGARLILAPWLPGGFA